MSVLLSVDNFAILNKVKGDQAMLSNDLVVCRGFEDQENRLRLVDLLYGEMTNC